MSKYIPLSSPGKVYLVGSGPGDPGLLTCRARELIESCDVICYDKLISPAILALAPATTPLLVTGYRGYCGAGVDYGMHPSVLEQALAGKSVLRLKSGDPFIFGRATEECSDLQRHGIQYEVVPGITAALGASAYAGFPLTSAGLASDVTIASGHQSSKTLTSWAALGASSGTLVLYMGAKKLAQHAARLIEEGRDPETPVAHISAATTAHQQVTTGTLATIGEQVLALDNPHPALVIMGSVVALREQLDWRCQLPLSGQQVLFVGAGVGAGAEDKQACLARRLRDAGAIVTTAPKVRCQHSWDESQWQRVTEVNQLHFNDPEAVASWWQKLTDNQLDLRHIHWQISAAEQTTLDALNRVGIFDVLSEQSKPAQALSLGCEHRADIGCWREQVSELAYQLQRPDIAVVTSLAACKALLEQQPQVLAEAKICYVLEPQVATLLAEQGIAHQAATESEIELLAGVAVYSQ